MNLADWIHHCFMQQQEVEQAHAFNQTHSLNAGLHEFGKEGHDAGLKEMGQLHGRKSLKPTQLRDLTDKEAKRASEAVTILL